MFSVLFIYFVLGVEREQASRIPLIISLYLITKALKKSSGSLFDKNSLSCVQTYNVCTCLCKCYQLTNSVLKVTYVRDFPGGPVVKTSPFNARGMGLVPGWGTKIPNALCLENQNRRQYSKANLQSNIVTDSLNSGPH